MKISFVFLFMLFHFSDAYTQVNTERTKVFFKTLTNVGVPPIACDTKVESAAGSSTPVDFKSVKLNNVSTKRMGVYEGVEVSVLTKDEAQRLFDSFKKLSYIPSKYLEDGCYARAHELALIAKNNGITFGKAFLLSNKDSELLYPKNIKAKNPDRFAKSFSGWKYHANAFVLVQNGDKLEPFVFDLGVSEKVQSFDEWKNNLARNPKEARIITKPGASIFHDNSFSSPDLSIIDSLVETQKTIDELGMDEYLFRLESGWL